MQEAIPFLEKSAAELPNRPAPRLVLAMAQFQAGLTTEARRTMAAAIRCYNWSEFVLEDQADCTKIWASHVLRREAEGVLLPNLPAFIQGTWQPQDNDERLALLGVCRFRGLYAKAARLYADAFADDPHLADEMNRDCLSRIRAREAPGDRANIFNTPCRYLAARCAALAGQGQGADGESLDDAERRKWRRQARDWLFADLPTWETMLAGDSGVDRDFARQILSRWQTDPELAGLRDQTELNELETAEREECRALWNRVNEVLNRRHAGK
jgi:serine/threonine-protein kinase